ncbi:MAG: N-acetyl-gamma-glutamyl-phosphate reductase [Thermoanaerobaculia bacterium]|nr:N-acetyl-gamma-glutamyl-phosphate reductase [Thermoanaerobaculia bacterium]
MDSDVRTVRVAVVGATGYSGAELTVLLARHRQAEISSLFSSEGGKSAPFSRLHPALAARSGPGVRPFRLEALLESAPDAVFLATPHETSAELAPNLLERGMSVIDISAAFRLKNPAVFEAAYGFAHPAPQLLTEAVYGLTEWSGDRLLGARLVANPGCYPTSVLLALKPILDLLAPAIPVVCDSKSGTSGAGKKADLAFSFSELSENHKAYGVSGHRHEPEMLQELGLAPGTPFSFVPHLLPIVRGMLSTIHVSFAAPQTAEDLFSRFAAAYAGSPFVSVRPHGEMPDVRSVANTPNAAIGFCLRDGGRRAVLVSVIDNLLKGAASQAVQNFNRVFGFPETEGLE